MFRCISIDCPVHIDSGCAGWLGHTELGREGSAEAMTDHSHSAECKLVIESRTGVGIDLDELLDDAANVVSPD